MTTESRLLLSQFGRLVVAGVAVYMGPRLKPNLVKTSVQARVIYVNELMTGYLKSFFGGAQMPREVFSSLCQWMKQKEILDDSRHVKFEEKVLIFLVIASVTTNRQVQSNFQHSHYNINWWVLFILTYCLYLILQTFSCCFKRALLPIQENCCLTYGQYSELYTTRLMKNLWIQYDT